MAQISIFVGTVFGNAEQVAEVLTQQLLKAKHSVDVFAPGSVKDMLAASNISICTSTTGSGDIPEELAQLFYGLSEKFPMLTDKTYAVVGLGDSSYGETFCGAGRKFDQLLEELTASRLTDLICIDAMETFEPEKEALLWLQSYLDQLNRQYP